MIEMPELGQLDDKAAASLAGLAPVARDSGTRSRQRHIHGGRARVRRSLYMATLSAIRHAPQLKVKYQRLVNAGKPGKVAMVAVMRNPSCSRTTCLPRTEHGRPNHRVKLLARLDYNYFKPGAI